MLGASSSDRLIPLGRNGVPVPASYGGSSRRGGQVQRGGLRRLPEDYDSDSNDSGSQDGASLATSVATLPRRKDETAEEKKARKGAVKESKVGGMLGRSVRSCFLHVHTHVHTSTSSRGGHGLVTPPDTHVCTCTRLQRAARIAKKDLKGQFKQENERQKRAMAAPAPATVSLS